jgi:hypothetical protein
MMAAAAPSLIMRAVVDGAPEEGVMATGMVAGRIADLPTCEELVARIEREAEARLAVLAGPRAAALA